MLIARAQQMKALLHLGLECRCVRLEECKVVEQVSSYGPTEAQKK